MFGTDSPWTSTSPSSGYSRPTMCLMHTDLPVPDGPEDHRDLALGDAHVQAAQDLVAPEGLVDVDELDGVGARPSGGSGRCASWYSSSSLAAALAHDGHARAPAGSSARRSPAARRRRAGRARLAGAAARPGRPGPRGRRRAASPPRARARSASRRRCGRRVVAVPCRQPPIGARGLAPQNSCVPSIPMRCTSTMLSTIDFAVAVPTPTGPPLGVVAVVAARRARWRSPSPCP